jgi:hydrogenase nickel incorporation protein HypB
MEINIGQHILTAHQEITAKNKELLRKHGILTINLMGSPGAGKTSVLEQLIKRLKPTVKIAVIEGDLYTNKDAARIEAQAIPVVQINTRGACHLDGKMIDWALQQLPLAERELLIIENIGNLVCPAEFDLGEDMRISVLSVTEGEDKVPKYPLMFKGAAAVILNKVDLLPYTDFNTEQFYHDLRLLNPDVAVFEVSCRLDTGMDKFVAWLQLQMSLRTIKEEK